MTASPINWFSQVFLYRLLQQRPDQSKNGFRQGYLHPSMAPDENVFTRTLLVQRTKAQNPLAGFYSIKGEAIPATDRGYDQMLMGLQDIKSLRYVDPDIVTQVLELGELAVLNASNTQAAKAKQATVMKELTRVMAFCDDQIDTSKEYMFMSALQGQITWPPTDDAGGTIDNPPDYWNGEQYAGTWPFPLEGNKIQNITTLRDKDNTLVSSVNANAAKVWSDPNAEPLIAIRAVRTLMRELYATRMEGGTMIMSTATWEYMLSNTSILNWLTGANKEQPDARRYMSDEELRGVIRRFGDMQVQLYDSFFTVPTGPSTPYGDLDDVTNVHFLKPGKVIFLPPGGISARFGTVPLPRPRGQEWQPGKYAWSYENPIPNHEVRVGVHAVYWPLFGEHYDWFVLDVLN